jgi:hypothetical protein
MSQRNEVCGPRLLDAARRGEVGLAESNIAALALDGRIEN